MITYRLTLTSLKLFCVHSIFSFRIYQLSPPPTHDCQYKVLHIKKLSYTLKRPNVSSVPLQLAFPAATIQISTEIALSYAHVTTACINLAGRTSTLGAKRFVRKPKKSTLHGFNTMAGVHIKITERKK